jgi:hypothetical protein
LVQAQKNNAPLARHTLVQRCISDPSILDFVCELAATAARVSRVPSQREVQLKLWVAVCLKLLIDAPTSRTIGEKSINGGAATRRADDKLVLLLIPYVLAGLKRGRSCSEFAAAASMVLVQMGQRTLLSEKVVSAAVVALVKATDQDASEIGLQQALLPLVCLFQTQQVENFPTKALHLVTQWRALEGSLFRLAEHHQYDIDDFLASFLHALALRHASDDCRVLSTPRTFCPPPRSRPCYASWCKASSR